MSENAETAKCPKCGSEKIAAIQYGLPSFSKKLLDEIEKGEIVLGGCVIDEDCRKWKCKNCGERFGKLEASL